MFKLVILIAQQENWSQFDSEWPGFLRLAESMPGLKREASSRVDQMLYGDSAFGQMHELFFSSLAEVESALASPQGQKAGMELQRITRGRMMLFISDHKEDEMANIRKYRRAEEPLD